MNPYGYLVSGSDLKSRLIAATSQRSHYEVHFAASHPTYGTEDNTICGDYFTPQNIMQVPLVILVPGFGNESIAPCLTLARLICKEGAAAFVSTLPIHSRYSPDTFKGSLAPSSPKSWLEIYQSSVLQIRQIIGWASEREEIIPKRIGIVGFSMGGMISSIAMAMDRRIYAGVLVVMGGNMEELSWGSESGALPVGHHCTREECHAIYCRYPDFIENVKQNGLENAIPAKECFLFDPLTFADQLRGRKLMLINAEKDEIIPRQSVQQFWEACGEPTLKWLPASHFGIYMHNQSLSQEINNFLIK